MSAPIYHSLNVFRRQAGESLSTICLSKISHGKILIHYTLPRSAVVAELLA